MENTVIEKIELFNSGVLVAIDDEQLATMRDEMNIRRDMILEHGAFALEPFVAHGVVCSLGEVLRQQNGEDIDFKESSADIDREDMLKKMIELATAARTLQNAPVTIGDKILFKAYNALMLDLPGCENYLIIEAMQIVARY